MCRLAQEEEANNGQGVSIDWKVTYGPPTDSEAGKVHCRGRLNIQIQVDLPLPEPHSPPMDVAWIVTNTRGRGHSLTGPPVECSSDRCQLARAIPLAYSAYCSVLGVRYSLMLLSFAAAVAFTASTDKVNKRSARARI